MALLHLDIDLGAEEIPANRRRLADDARAALAVTSLSWHFAFNFYVAHRSESP